MSPPAARVARRLCRAWRCALLAAVVPLLFAGCGRPAAIVQPGDAPRPVSAGQTDPRDRTAAVLQDMSRYVYAAEPGAGRGGGQMRLITFGPFVNQTSVPADRFARFRDSFQQTLKRRSRSFGLLFADAPPQSRPPRYELRASALPIGADGDRVLLRLALVGLDRRDRRTTIWSDNLILPRP